MNNGTDNLALIGHLRQQIGGHNLDEQRICPMQAVRRTGHSSGLEQVDNGRQLDSSYSGFWLLLEALPVT